MSLVDSSLHNPELPELIIEVPEAEEGIDISAWCSNTKRILGKQYNVIFKIKDEEEKDEEKEEEDK